MFHFRKKKGICSHLFEFFNVIILLFDLYCLDFCRVIITPSFILFFSCEVRYDLSLEIKMWVHDYKPIKGYMMKQKGQMHKIRWRLMDKSSIINSVRSCLATVCESFIICEKCALKYDYSTIVKLVKL